VYPTSPLRPLSVVLYEFSSFVQYSCSGTGALGPDCLVNRRTPQAASKRPKHPMLRAILLVCVCCSSALSVPAEKSAEDWICQFFGFLDSGSCDTAPLLAPAVATLSKFYAPLTARSAGEITASGFTTYFNYEGDLQVHGTRLTSNCAAPGY